MLVICIHNVVKLKLGSCWDVTEYQLESLLDRLLEQAHEFTSLDSLSTAHDRSVAITIDDGRRGAGSWLLRSAQARKFVATIFVVPRWIDDPTAIQPHERIGDIANWREIAKLKDAGHLIGSHGMTHTPLPILEEPGIRMELEESKNRIREKIGIEAAHFAAPYGKLNPLVINAAKRIGYKTISSTLPGINTREDLQSGILKRMVLRSDLPDLGWFSRKEATV